MSLRLAWLGHSTTVLDVQGVRLVTDPLLTRHPGPLRRRGDAPDGRSWRETDGVLLSHLHHDHAHLPSLRLLPGVPVVTGAENAGWLRARGISPVVGLAGDDWAGIGARQGEAAVRVRLTPAVHGSRPMPHRPNGAHGHLVRAGEHTIWVAGDTELFSQMADLPRLAGAPIDLAVVPISGWGPRLSAGHMDADRAARACALVGARAAVPVHWGTLHLPGGRHLPRGWMDRAAAGFAGALRRYAPGCQAVVLHRGESVALF